MPENYADDQCDFDHQQDWPTDGREPSLVGQGMGLQKQLFDLPQRLSWFDGEVRPPGSGGPQEMRHIPTPLARPTTPHISVSASIAFVELPSLGRRARKSPPRRNDARPGHTSHRPAHPCRLALELAQRRSQAARRSAKGSAIEARGGAFAAIGLRAGT